jgi:hypothetical protein
VPAIRINRRIKLRKADRPAGVEPQAEVHNRAEEHIPAEAHSPAEADSPAGADTQAGAHTRAGVHTQVAVGNRVRHSAHTRRMDQDAIRAGTASAARHKRLMPAPR